MPPKGAQQPKGKAAVKSTPPSKSGPTWTAPKTITHPEHHHTLNHLNQVAAYYAVLSSTSDASSTSTSTSALQLQSELTRSAKTLSRKAVIRLDTSVKRGVCGRCDAVLVEGLTASVRSKVSGPHDHVLKKRCGVCGTVIRVPAPDLVPALGKSDKGGETKRVRVEKKLEEKSEVAKERQKVSQRQRRRTGSIKRQLLRDDTIEASVEAKAASSTNPSTSKPKLSRGQRRQARIDRLQERFSSQNPGATTATAPAVKRPRQTLQLSLPTTAVSGEALEPCTTTVESAADKAESQPAPLRDGRAQRPQLPHFNDRVQGSCWDETFTKLSSHLSQLPKTVLGSQPETESSATQNEEREVAAQALEYWQKAARSRGDHLLVTGVGKNGSLGASVP